jgi:hypothetical protein
MNDTDLADRADVFSPDSAPSLFLGGPLREKADLARLANPITYVDPQDPPVFIGHGEKDAMVPIGQSEILYEALNEAGVPATFVRVKNAKHMYRPYKWDQDVSPTVEDMNRLTVEWFEKWLGRPELDLTRIEQREPKPEPSSGKKIPFSYRLTLEFPGETAAGTCRGRFMIRAGDKILYRGNIQVDDLSPQDGPFYRQDLVLEESDLTGKEIAWNFQGEIHVSPFDEPFPVMFIQGEKYDSAIEGVGFCFRISQDGTVDIEKKVYRR